MGSLKAANVMQEADEFYRGEATDMIILPILDKYLKGQIDMQECIERIREDAYSSKYGLPAYLA